MASGQRAFTQKLSKQHAADVRRNIAYSGKNNIFSNSYCSGWSGDVVEPLDYEDFLAQHHMLIERDPLNPILDFPIGDVQIALLTRHIRTLHPVVPEEKLEDLAPHVQSCVRCFTSDWQIIKYLHRQYSSSVTGRIFHLHNEILHKKEFEIDFQSYSSVESSIDSDFSSSSRQSLVSSCTDNTLTPRNSWAGFDLRNSVGDPLIPELLERISPENIDQVNESRRQEDRQESLFSVYHVAEGEEPIERRLLAEAPSENVGHRIMVKCLQLKLEIEVEPIFATMALYDAKEKKKLSENFYFDMNSENVKRMLGGHIPFSDISSLSRSCIFNITHPSPDLFIVVRLEKVLQGDINECVEPYMKDDKINRQKVKENAVIMCERLGKYRQAFAWTAIYLMNVINGISSLERDTDSNSIGSTSSTNSLERKISSSGLDQLRRRATDMGSLTRRGSLERKSSEKRRSWSPDHFSNGLDTFRPLTLTVTSFFKLESERLKDEDLYKFLQELKRPCQVMKKLKCIPGFLKLDISPCPQQPQEIKYCLTPELQKLIPYPDEDNEDDDKSRPVKELIEYPIRDILLPHYSYRNLLFVSPKELNFSNRTGSARNIAVKVQLMSGESEQNALCNIFGKSSCPEFTTEAYTAVTYHSKTPIFYDEIKMKLPATLGDQHHLLFTFYHISCQRKETQTTVDTPVGYTWLPLFKDGCLATGEFCLPVMLEPPPLNYRYIPPDVCLPGTKWLDNHKGLFNVYLDAVSSIHTQDKYIEKFFMIYDHLESGKIPSRIGESNMESELRTCMNDLGSAKPEALVKNVCVILDTLLKMMVQPPFLCGHRLSVSHTTFETICTLLKNISNLNELAMDQHGRLSILATYVQYQCMLPHSIESDDDVVDVAINTEEPDTEVEQIAARNSIHPTINTSNKILHQELALQWVVSSGAVKHLAMLNSWFLFDLMIKSMVQHLAVSQLLDEPRKNRFPEQFIDDVTTLVHTVTSEIIAHFILEPRLANQLNTSVAFFLFDLFSIVDRGYVLHLIRAYCKQMAAKISSLPDAVHLVELKLDLLRIVCSHEHYVQLNLPFGTPYTMSSAPVSPSPSISSSASQTSFLSSLTNQERVSSYAELSLDYKQQHYLTGLILADLTIVLEMQNNHLHSKAISILRNLLTCHDSDARLSRGPEYKMRVAALYIPLLSIAMDALPLLYYRSNTSTATTTTNTYFNPEESINQNVALAIAGKGPTPTYTYDRKYGVNAEVTRHLLVCVLWVLKNLHSSVLNQWLSELSATRLSQFLQVLDVCITCFEYKGKKEMKRCTQQSFHKTTDIKSKLEDVILGQGSARSEMMQRRKERTIPLNTNCNSSDKLRWKKEQMTWTWRSTIDNISAGVPGVGISATNQMENDAQLEGNLATEATFIILDMVERVVSVAMSADGQQSTVSWIFKILLHALARNQSTTVLPHMFATQRSLVFKFHGALFDEETEQCADLCLLLLKHCGSMIASVRSQSAASLYLLMRQTFEIGNNFARIKMQVTISLSSLVGTNTNFSEEYLKRSLKTILEYAERDAELQDTSFPEQVRDLVFNLHMILSDTVKMKEFQEDPEMLLDLMYRIAKGYQNSPDLRLTWLASMAQKHMERNNHSEAGMCLVHSAALVAEYVAMQEPLPYLPTGAVSLQNVSPNVLDESAVSDDVLSPEQEGICLGSHFTEAGLLGLLEHAASSFQQAAMYEPINDIYKVLIPIAEHNRDFKKLANIHGKLHEAYTRIDQLQGKRVFGTYFRVGFYGDRFGDLDRDEYIYKEPTLTKLPEIFSRLENFYAERFGADNVCIIKDSNSVDLRKLDAQKAYIQITYVEPYFDPYELRHRQTHFDRNFNIKRFIYSTPFTHSGKAHGELHEQFKRKTILTTTQFFPYVKTRIRVIEREQMVLSPIEVAIEDIEKKIAELVSATVQEPPDPKILQMVLQGCIGTTVNQGPMEMAHVFLSAATLEGKPLTKHQHKLRLCFKDFSKRCQDALRKNKNLITVDQRDYQRELERNYRRFTERLQPLIVHVHKTT